MNDPKSWLNNAPPGWLRVRLGQLGQFDASGIDKKSIEDETPVAMVNYTDVYGNKAGILRSHTHYMRVTAPPEKARRCALKRGDVLFTPSSETADEIGVAAVVEDDMPGTVFSYHLVRFKTSSAVDHTFRRHLFNSPLVQRQLARLAKGTTRQILTRSDFRSVEILLPPVECQRAIADFLDRKTAALDALIDKKERLLTLLQEKRQALITQAVTKGLDPNVPMKDSGIEWLGEIPAHWEVVPIKHLARLQTGTTPPTAEDRYYENGSVPWFGPSSVGDGLFVGAPVKHLNLSAVLDGRARLIPALSTLVTCIGATLGRSGLLESEGTANQQITSLSFDPCHGDPLFMALSIKRLEPVLRERAQYTTLPIVNQSELGTYPLAVPPILEQHAIACAAKNELGRVDSLELTTRRSIARLSEYRQTLITAAVTGQLDVTGEQA